jgi:predicted phosphoribosyltransferase
MRAVRFSTREEAGRLVAEKLGHLRTLHPVVLGVAHGGLPLAKIVAEALGGDLDVVVIHRLTLASRPGETIGAIDEEGSTFLPANDALTAESELKEAMASATAEVERRRAVYASAHQPVPIRGRVAVVVDEGVITGSTLVAAIRYVRGRRPRRVVAAVPLATSPALGLVRAHADEVVCLRELPAVRSFAEFYDVLPLVTDSEVLHLLSTSGTSRLPA